MFRYILQLAAENGGVVVSNDNFKDLFNEKAEFRKVIEERILMYSFANDRLIVEIITIKTFWRTKETFGSQYV